MKTILMAAATLLAFASPALSQATSNLPSANIDLGKRVLDRAQQRRLGCHLTPGSRACATGPRPEQRQPQQRRTAGRGGGPRP
jgi:hypothetical protein